ncbi:MAG: hypothetical protein ACK55S_02025 [Planctomycetota bacterium]
MFSRSVSMLACTLVCAAWCLSGSWTFGQVQVPAIDPSGNQIFLPPGNSTNLLTPGTVASPYQTPAYPGAVPGYPQPGVPPTGTPFPPGYVPPPGYVAPPG